MSHPVYTEEFGVLPWNVKPTTVQGRNPNEPKPEEKEIIRYGGLDIAKRVDHSALEVLRGYENNKTGERVLKEEAFMLWPHVKYRIISQDIYKAFVKFPWDQLGFDRSGVGDAASELFDITGMRMEPIVTTDNVKKDIVAIIRALFESKKLFVGRESELVRQIEEQELIKTPAGNMRYAHPQNRHDDRFWALGYACYVALPWILNYPPPMIRRISNMEELPDVDQMIDQLMGYDSSVMQL